MVKFVYLTLLCLRVIKIILDEDIIILFFIKLVISDYII